MDIKQIEEAKRFLSSKPEDITKEFVRNLVYYFGVYYGEMLGNIYGYHKAKCKVRDALMPHMVRYMYLLFIKISI